MEGSADLLPLSENSMDKVVCHQGFQFFPNKTETAKEIHRVIKTGGKAVVSTWYSINNCEIFVAICEALDAIDDSSISQTMRIPFNFTEDELMQPYDKIQFSNLKISKIRTKPLLRGEEMAIKLAYTTPIGHELNVLDPKRQEEFKNKFIDKLQILKRGDGSFGRMVTNVLHVEKRFLLQQNR